LYVCIRYSRTTAQHARISRVTNNSRNAIKSRNASNSTKTSNRTKDNNSIIATPGNSADASNSTNDSKASSRTLAKKKANNSMEGGQIQQGFTDTKTTAAAETIETEDSSQQKKVVAPAGSTTAEAGMPVTRGKHAARARMLAEVGKPATAWRDHECHQQHGCQ
jgi:hypothetical protein